MPSVGLKPPPLSLYIHIPWCIKKCPYCDFNSHQKDGELPEQEYIDALLEDLAQDSAYIQNRTLLSIFIGGGTPSLFSAKGFDYLLNKINRVIPFENSIEITLEANPGTFEQQKFSDFRRAGINRLSIGIQSFQKQFLQSLGRIHDDQEALKATDIATQAGFENFNLDLMFGLPNQRLEQALKDLEIAISCGPSHLSWYQLTVEPNTEFYSSPPPLPDDEKIFQIQQQGQALLAGKGYSQYEISAYCQPNKQSTHNLNYWRFGDYLGIGAGAHGKLTLSEESRVIRTRKTRQPKHYLDKQKAYITETRTLTQADLPLEFMMNAMRLCEGASISAFEQRTGLSINVMDRELAQLRHAQLMVKDKLRPTAKGQLFLNDLLSTFV
jgi:putative oxygen-independent coproporphyrinogen III oxidase